MIYLFLANGFEEIEAVAPVDVLRRCGLEVKSVCIEENPDYLITGAHGITIKADLLADEVNYDDIEAVILPGGMPGTKNLEASDGLRQILEFCYSNGRLICAICAAPSILGHLGMLNGKKATCFPGFERTLACSVFTGASVTIDGNIITADGPGSAVKFGEAIASKFVGGEAARRVSEDMQSRF